MLQGARPCMRYTLCRSTNARPGRRESGFACQRSALTHKPQIQTQIWVCCGRQPSMCSAGERPMPPHQAARIITYPRHPTKWLMQAREHPAPARRIITRLLLCMSLCAATPLTLQLPKPTPPIKQCRAMGCPCPLHHARLCSRSTPSLGRHFLAWPSATRAAHLHTRPARSSRPAGRLSTRSSPSQRGSARPRTAAGQEPGRRPRAPPAPRLQRHAHGGAREPAPSTARARQLSRARGPRHRRRPGQRRARRRRAARPARPPAPPAA